MENLLYRINFKRIALTNKITATNSAGAVVSYSHQKFLKLKERVLFYSDANKQAQVAEINADSVIDYNVKYSLTNNAGQLVYRLERLGSKSIWKAHYQIKDGAGNVILNINEKNAWTKVIDTLFGEIPFVGLLAGYVFHAEYLMTDQSGNLRFTIKKKPALLESNFEIYTNDGSQMDLHLLQITSMAIMRERIRS